MSEELFVKGQYRDLVLDPNDSSIHLPLAVEKKIEDWCYCLRNYDRDPEERMFRFFQIAHYLRFTKADKYTDMSARELMSCQVWLVENGFKTMSVKMLRTMEN